MELLEFKELYKSYGKKEVLNNINFKIGKGRIVGLLGANGSGKTTIIKLINGLLIPSLGNVYINGKTPGIESKKIVSYLPERTYLNFDMKVSEIVRYFEEFYDNFDSLKAYELFEKLKINKNDRLKNMSKGTKEKVQLVLVMSRKAQLYILDEPIGGVDPAARDYILDTIISNFDENASIIISTHLIADVERVLDDVIFLNNGKIKLYSSADKLRQEHDKSIDAIFREVFKC